MKKVIITLIYSLFVFIVAQHAQAQNPLSQTTQCEVGIGFVKPFLQSGQELTAAVDIRDQGLSYFEDTNGDRKQVGSYPGLKGLSIHLAFYKPIKKVKGLMIGAAMRNAQTGTEPKDGGYEEGYFFNFITAGLALKYYPFEKNNLFFKGDFGMAAVLTKNRFKNEADEQQFLHQFGIGTGLSVGTGYSLTPFKNKSKSLDVQLVYQQLSTRVEVNGIGDDHWKFGALHLTTAFVF